MLKIESSKQFDASLSQGKVLLFCHDMSDVTSALHAVLARHRDRNDPIIIFTQTETETFSPDKYHEKHQSIHIPTDRIDENTCVTIAKLVDSEKPVRVYLPAFNAQYTCLALQVWEGVRRATHQICIGIGELDQPLTEVSAWFENENPPPPPCLQHVICNFFVLQATALNSQGTHC